MEWRLCTLLSSSADIRIGEVNRGAKRFRVFRRASESAVNDKSIVRHELLPSLRVGSGSLIL
jgi:hypothetical protein